MTAHERALELGAAAFDFHLTAAERNDLDRHLADCAQCRSDLDGMADDARRLESRPAHRMPPDAAAAVRGRLERPRRGLSPAMVLVAAALLILAALATLAVGAEIQRRLDESRLAVEPVPSGVPAPSALPAPTPGVAAAWSMTSLGTTSGIPFPAAAVASSELGWIAVGERTCVRTGDEIYDCAASVARSDDGRAWTLAGTLPYATAYVPVTSGPEPGIVDLAAGRDGYVAVGFALDGEAAPVMGLGDGAAWWSADGLTWERTLLEDGARPSAVFRAPDRWLIGGVVYRGVDLLNDRPIGAVWTSTDGRTWTRIEDDTAFDVGGYFDTMEDPSAGGINAFAWNGTVLVAGGEVYAEGGLPSTAAAWLSDDGTAWERAGFPAAGQAVEDLAAVGGRFVAAVRRCPVSGDCTTVVLHSGDGRAWEAVPGDLPPFAAMAGTETSILLATSRYVLADQGEALEIRVSPDGATWDLLGSVSREHLVNWGRPVLLPHAGGRVDLLVRFDPVNDRDTGADAWTALWEIAPRP